MDHSFYLQSIFSSDSDYFWEFVTDILKLTLVLKRLKMTFLR